MSYRILHPKLACTITRLYAIQNGFSLAHQANERETETERAGVCLKLSFYEKFVMLIVDLRYRGIRVGQIVLL